MEKITKEQLKKEMVFHLYGRFAPICDIIEKNRKNNEKLRILDVGGRGNWMKKFFPEDDVFYIDPNIDSNDENFIKGDGCNMSLEDESFDWVVSTDVFEHIPKGKRKIFLEENLRVCSCGVILVAPFYEPEVAQAEINANENYKNLHEGNDHIWLKEHIENGLPDMDEFENLLKEKKINFQKLHNNRLFLWQLLIGTEFLIDENISKEINNEVAAFNYLYNTEVFPFDNQEPSYRKIYFIKKNPSLEDIKVEAKTLDDKLFLKIISERINIICKIDSLNRDSMSKMEQIISRNNEEMELIISRNNEEMELMKSSKFWKLRGLYLRLKNKIIKK